MDNFELTLSNKLHIVREAIGKRLKGILGRNKTDDVLSGLDALIDTLGASMDVRVDIVSKITYDDGKYYDVISMEVFSGVNPNKVLMRINDSARRYNGSTSL